MINLNEFIETINSGRSWLSYYVNNPIGELHYHFNNYTIFPTMSGKVTTNYPETTTAYYPTITLIPGVKIIQNTSCSNSVTRDCPYLLEYNEEKTHQ